LLDVVSGVLAMIKGLIVIWIVLTAAIAITAGLVSSVHIDGGVFATLGVALVFGLVNALIGPVLRLVSLPLTLATFGLFSLVVNAALLGITAGLSDNLDVGGFWSALWAALLISFFSAILQLVAHRWLGDAPST
jgi:putative membrane protein